MKRRWLACLGVLGCGSAPHAIHPQAANAQLSLAADDRMITIPAGKYIAGSTPEERGASYDDHLSATSSDLARERKWFEHEEARHQVTLPAFRIDLMPVTQGQYAEFVTAGKAAAPMIDEPGWKAQGFPQDFATEVVRYVWKAGSSRRAARSSRGPGLVGRREPVLHLARRAARRAPQVADFCRVREGRAW